MNTIDSDAPSSEGSDFEKSERNSFVPRDGHGIIPASLEATIQRRHEKSKEKGEKIRNFDMIRVLSQT